MSDVCSRSPYIKPTNLPIDSFLIAQLCLFSLVLLLTPSSIFLSGKQIYVSTYEDLKKFCNSLYSIFMDFYGFSIDVHHASLSNICNYQIGSQVITQHYCIDNKSISTKKELNCKLHIVSNSEQHKNRSEIYVPFQLVVPVIFMQIVQFMCNVTHSITRFDMYCQKSN